MIEEAEQYLLFVNKGKGTILKADSRGKLYVISSEDNKMRYYQKVGISPNQCFPVYTNEIKKTRDEYPEYFI